MKEEEEQQKNYGLDIRRHSAHSRTFPWMALVKIIIGIAIVSFTWYLAETLFQKFPAMNKEKPGNPQMETAR